MTNTARKGVKKTVRTRATYQKILDRQLAAVNRTLADLKVDGFSCEHGFTLQGYGLPQIERGQEVVIMEERYQTVALEIKVLDGNENQGG